jgi:hypothetical protein
MVTPKVDYSYVMKEGKHYPMEHIWLGLQPWLKSCGYTLRDRYQPGWTASWLKPGVEKDWPDCEDSLVPDVCGVFRATWLLTELASVFLQFSHLLDATREDGSLVMLKRIKISQHPHEVEIGRLFSSEPLSSNLKNCCVPFYDVLRIPDDDDGAILVMPLLYEVEYPPFQTVGEVVEFFRQIFEVTIGLCSMSMIYLFLQGLQLMHQNHIAHRYADSNF